MIRILHGDIVSAPQMGKLNCLKDGYIISEDARIIGMYDTIPEGYRTVPVDDYSGRLILQGFSDMHLHAPQYPMLGMGMDLQLLEWLDRYTYRTESAFSDLEYARKIYRQLANELVQNGTTRVCMFASLHTDATLVLMEELETAGISGYVGKVNMDRNSKPYYQETLEQSKRETLRWIHESERFSKVKPILTPRFTPSCSDELLEWLGQVANAYNLPVQSHLSENLREIEWVKQLHPDIKRYWESYAKYGLFKNDTLMAHCVYSDELERMAIRDHGVTIVHCPDSNINVTSGIAPVKQMLDEGAKVVIGSDIAGGAQISMLQVMQMTIRVSKVKRMETAYTTPFLTAAEAYYLGTSAGAVYFGEKPGFAEGNTLHAVVIEDRRFPNTSSLQMEERLERAIYRASTNEICAVYGSGDRIR